MYVSYSPIVLHSAEQTKHNPITQNDRFTRYRGLSAVMAGIVPKMSVRFSSFELYKEWLGAEDGHRKGETTNKKLLNEGGNKRAWQGAMILWATKYFSLKTVQRYYISLLS